MRLFRATLATVCLISASFSHAESHVDIYEASQYLQTTSDSRNVTATHIVNTSDVRQAFTGTLYNGNGERLGAADQALSTGEVAPKGRLIISSEDLESLFGVSAWTGPAILNIKGSAHFEVMSKLTSPSGLISNTNCTRERSVHNIEGFDSPNLSYVRFINTGAAAITGITGSLYNGSGEPIGERRQALMDNLPPKAAEWLNRDQLSDIFGDTWNGDALLEIDSEHEGLRLLLLNLVSSGTFFNFSCYEAASETPEPASASANYRLTFVSEWSNSTHPGAYPSSAHFSPLIGAIHNSGVTFWKVGELATRGLENVAETGSTARMSGEIDDAIAAGSAAASISPRGNINAPGNISVEFTASLEHPFVTLATMIAPSPDWFVGVSGLALLKDGAWLDEISVDLFAYDAGTEDGNGFSLSNPATSPKEPISRITSAPFPAGSARLGVFMFERLD